MAKERKRVEIVAEDEADPKAGGKAHPKKGKKESGKKELDALKEKIEALERERNEFNDKLLRLHAETENFKKRMTREKDDFVRYSNERVVKEFLPVIDNLERAVDHAKEASEKGSLLEGVEMTLNLFHQALNRIGVSQVSAVGEPFNPERHEAVQQIESDEHEPNIVVSEFQKGYMLHERLVRPAMVVVARPAAKKEIEKKETEE